MERIKKFLLDESGTAEASSTVIMVAAVGILLGLGMATYYGAINGFFNSTQTTMESYGSNLGPKF
jgi:Flp pilus assembly pilin Flp